MEDQLEEKEALEMENWNSEYDIGDDEEERLLEEHGDKTPFPCDSETNLEDAEFHIQDGEEDILDLGLNEDQIEYEEPNSEPQEVLDTVKKCAAIVTDTAGSSSGPTVQKEAHTPKGSTIGMRAHQMKNRLQSPGLQRSPNYSRLPFNLQIPLQVRGIAPFRMSRPVFHNQRPQFDVPTRPMIARIPSIFDYRHPPASGFMRNSTPVHNEPFFAQDYNHNPPGRPIRMGVPGGHYLLNQQHFPDPEGNNNGNRLFINPHYRGSVLVQNAGNNRSTPYPDIGPRLGAQPTKPPCRMNFPPRPPLPGPLTQRFRPPNQCSVPPPLPNVPLDHTLSARFKAPPPPQNLMDVVLPDPLLGLYTDQSRTSRFRFPVPASDLPPPMPRFPGPPSNGVKRLAPTELKTAAPLKQLRLGPVSSIPMKRTLQLLPITNSEQDLAPSHAGFTAPVTSVCSRQSGIPNHHSAAATSTSGPTTPAIASLASSSTATERTVRAVSRTAPVANSSSRASVLGSPPSIASAPKVLQSNRARTSADSGDVSPEMKDYLQKMEEQRKKREEVLKIKEERRRLKLASLSARDSDEPTKEALGLPLDHNQTAGIFVRKHMGQLAIASMLLDAAEIPSNNSGLLRVDEPVARGSSPGKNVAVAVHQPKIVSGAQHLQSAAPSTHGGDGSSPAQRKTLLVKPTTSGATSAVSNPTVGVSRRYKVIIVKNKNGKILEKRRVPIDEALMPTNNLDRTSRNTVDPNNLLHDMGRISETVTVENLNSHTTEEDIRNLCQQFGVVQEIYPKLREGKAIVRFSSVAGANNFLRNHKTPGICVRFV